MARARNIKPALFKNEILGQADPLYTLLFESLWLLADRAGRLEDRPMRIKAETFPYREGLNCDAMLGWLSEKGFIIRYKSGENRYIQIVNFEKHQNPHKNEPDSEIPSFSDGCTTSDKIGTDSEKIGSARADSLNLIPDSLSLDSGLLITENATHVASPDGDDQPNTPERRKTLAAKDLIRDHGIPDQLAADFMAIRKAKRAPLTKTSLAGIEREAHSAGLTLSDAIKICAENGWQGFKKSWYDNMRNSVAGSKRASPSPENFKARDYTAGINPDGSF